ncbi:MAG: hypothetical protein ACK4V2_07740 [Pseudomonadota bacterium]
MEQTSTITIPQVAEGYEDIYRLLASENSLRIRNRGESVIRQACARDFQAVDSSSFSPSYWQEQWAETRISGVEV